MPVIWPKLYCGDCLEILPKLPSRSVDLILADPPYGTTACSWDSVIDLTELWPLLRRVGKVKAPAVLFASQPFTTDLINSNRERFVFSWAWDKGIGANFVQAKRQPMKIHEDILVFSVGGTSPIYYPQMTEREVPLKGGGKGWTEAIPIRGEKARAKFAAERSTRIYTHKFPESILKFSCRQERGFHPTQKPVALLEFLIKTHSSEGDTVLDFSMGSGSTGVACKNTGRKFIGIEVDPTHFEVAKKRIAGNISVKEVVRERRRRLGQ